MKALLGLDFVSSCRYKARLSGAALLACTQVNEVGEALHDLFDFRGVGLVADSALAVFGRRREAAKNCRCAGRGWPAS